MKTVKKHFLSLGPALLTGAAMLASVVTAYGGSVSGMVSEPTNVISNAQDISNLLCSALLWMFWGLIVLSVAMFLIGGYTYATAAGNAEKVSKANKTMLYASIAVVVAILAKGIPLIIGSFFHVSLAYC